MYGVLIVDDERYVRLWVKNCICWEDYGFEIIGEAEDGSDALNRIKELNPRLVISDMEMPDIDGAKLIEKAGRLYPEVLFLVLSGYNSFEYMRSAVKNNAVDYLLKPVNEEDIIPVIEKIRCELEKQDAKKEDKARMKALVKENLEHRREKLFVNLLDEYVLTAQEVQTKLTDLGINFSGEFFNTLSIRFDEEAFAELPANATGTELLKLSISNITEEILAANRISSYSLNRRNEVICIINYSKPADDGYQRITGICREIISNVNTLLKVPVSIGLGITIKDILEIGASYTEAKRSLELMLIYGNNSVLTFLSVPANFNREVFTIADENHLANSIASLDYNSCKIMVGNIFDNLIKTNSINIETIKMVYYRLVSAILKEIYKAGITPSYLQMEEIDMFTAIKSLNTIEQIREKSLDFLQSCIEGIANTQKIKNSAVEKAKCYIRENFKNEITLADISKYVHMTPNYFSTLFKTEMGYNVFDYITGLRIDKVKLLMLDRSLKTYEIGELVGYKEPKYFCRVFKKISGQSPLQYRKQLLKG